MAPPALAARRQAPILYRIAKRLERRKIRGSTRLLRILKQIGHLDRAVDFRLNESISIRVPIARNGYDKTDVGTYEAELVAALGEEIKLLPTPVTLIDIGADIGLFSLRVLAKCPSVSSVFAFEPNGEGFPWLQLNLSRLPRNIRATAMSTAIADFKGRGKLAVPEAHFNSGMETHHTQFFLEPAPGGPIEVATIDSLALPAASSVVIKIDVEGGELAALRGAAGTIAAAAVCVVVLEAHPAVVRRTGIDPVECLRLLASVRPFRFVVSEDGRQLGADRAVFAQIAPDHVYNLIARSQ